MRFVLIKTIGGPGSLGFLAAGAVVGLLLMLPVRTRRLGRLMLMALGVMYLALSVPAVAQAVSARVTSFQPGPASAIGKFNDMFVLDGDNYQARAARAAELYAEVTPQVVWVLGGGDLWDDLIAHGIPKDRLRQFGVPENPTTYGQIVQMKQLMTRHGSSRAVVVASRIQAPRVAGLARRLGMDVVVIASPMDREPASTGIGRWLPSLAALALSRDALYERVAVVYYRWKGWIE